MGDEGAWKAHGKGAWKAVEGCRSFSHLREEHIDEAAELLAASVRLCGVGVDESGEALRGGGEKKGR